MKYCVTGATGFVGSHVVRQLLNAGHTVTAPVRSLKRASDLAAMGVELYEGDVTDKESLRPAMAGVDGLFHIAGWYKVGSRDTSMAEKVNVEGTRNVLEMMQELEIPKGVYTSTLAVFSDTHGKMVDESYEFRGAHLSVYDRTKWDAHFKVARHMINHGLPLVIVLPGLIYGPGDTSTVRTNFVQYLQGKLPMMPAKTAFCWSHVEDAATAHILAMEKGKPGESYIIAGPKHTFVEAMELAQKLTGIRAPTIRVSPWMMKMMAVLMGPVGAVFPLPPTYTSEGLRIVAGVTYIGDNSKAARELGYTPRPLISGLRETLDHELKLIEEER